MSRKKILLSLFSVLSVVNSSVSLAAGPPPEVTIENVRIGFGDSMRGGQY